MSFELPLILQTFLMRISILERLSPELCQTLVSGLDGSDEMEVMRWNCRDSVRESWNSWISPTCSSYPWTTSASGTAFTRSLQIFCVTGWPTLSLIVGSIRYDFELQFSLLIVPVFILVVLMATSVGYAIALLSPKAELVGVLTNLISFSLFLFSPVNFPVERLPGWWDHPSFPAGEVCSRRGTRGDIIKNPGRLESRAKP